MKRTLQNRLTKIIENADLSNSDKIEKILVIRQDSITADRAATEGGTTNEVNLDVYIEIIDEALNVLGHDINNSDGTTVAL